MNEVVEPPLEVRRARPEDIPGCVAVQEETWPSGSRASEAQLRRRLDIHPEGFFVVLVAGRVRGSLTTLRLASYPFDEPLDWYATTGSGWGDPHDPDGEILHAIDLSIVPTAPRESMRRLLEAAALHAIDRGMRCIVAGIRLPGFARWADRLTAAEYAARRRRSGRPLDPFLARVLAFPGVELVKIVPGYFSDRESRDFGAVVRWVNPQAGGHALPRRTHPG